MDVTQKCVSSRRIPCLNHFLPFFFSFQSSLSSFTPTPLPISLSPSSSDTKAGGKVKSSRSRAHYSQIGRAEGNSENEVCMTEFSF